MCSAAGSCPPVNDTASVPTTTVAITTTPTPSAPPATIIAGADAVTPAVDQRQQHPIGLWQRFRVITKNPPLWLIYIFLTTVQVTFSGASILGKYTMNRGTKPLVFALIREIISTIVLFVLARIMDGKWSKVDKKDIPRFIVLGFCSFGNVVGVCVGLGLTTAPIMAVWQPSIPVFCMLFSYLLGLEALNLSRVGGILCSFAGAAIVVAVQFANTSTSGKTTAEMVFGNLCLLGNCVTCAFLFIAQKRIIKKYSAVSVTAWFYSFGSIFTVFVAFYYVDQPAAWTLTQWDLWIALAYYCAGNSCFCFIMLTYCNRFVPSSTATAFHPLQPFVTSFLSMIFLGQTVNGWEACGGLVICIGLYMIAFSKPPTNVVLKPVWAWCAPTDPALTKPASELTTTAADSNSSSVPPAYVQLNDAKLADVPAQPGSSTQHEEGVAQKDAVSVPATIVPPQKLG